MANIRKVLSKITVTSPLHKCSSGPNKISRGEDGRHGNPDHPETPETLAETMIKIDVRLHELLPRGLSLVLTFSTGKLDMSMSEPHPAPSGRARSQTPHAPVVPIPAPRAASASREPSPAPRQGSIRRTQTPFTHAQVVDEDEDEDSSTSAPHARPQSSARPRTPIYTAPQQTNSLRRTPSRGQPQPVYQHQQAEAALRDLDIVRALEPLEPAHPSAFGPSEPRSQTPLRNPLPPPPRDLYETSPYKSLLTLPQTTALLTANFAPKPTGKDAKKSRKGGLFRAFSSRKHEKEETKDPKVHFIPIFVNNPPAGGGNANPPMPAIPPLPQGGVPGPSGSTRRVPGHFQNRPQVIRYNEESDYWSFMNHSPHRIFFEDKEWPTATHLVEARKFLPEHPDIAHEIRLCGDVAHVYPISANYQQFQDPHWSEKHIQVVRLVTLYIIY
jgi:hypothetical protein